MEPSRKRAGLSILTQFVGILGVGTVWYYSIRSPNVELLAQYNSYYLSQQGSCFTDFVKNILMQPIGIYFSRLPVLFPASIYLTAHFLLKPRFKFQPPLITFAWTWLILGLAFLAPLGYRPYRYYLPLLIPTVILGWRCLVQEQSLENSSWRNWVAGIFTLALVLVNVPLLVDRFLTNGELLGVQPVPGFPVAASLICLPVTTGIRELRSACFNTTLVEDAPLA